MEKEVSAKSTEAIRKKGFSLFSIGNDVPAQAPYSREKSQPLQDIQTRMAAIYISFNVRDRYLGDIGDIDEAWMQNEGIQEAVDVVVSKQDSNIIVVIRRYNREKV